MSLYLKYRPKDFDEVVGNDAVIEALDEMTNTPEKCPHAFLLTGPTGCGKTTTARIIANRLGCGKEDYKEVDTADFRGIDTMRKLRQEAQYRPMNGKVRVFVLDEIHGATRDAQNALLKILEDTPRHVYFILATTDPQKLLPTVRGRCSVFEMKALTDEEMMVLLRHIVKAENENLQKLVYQQIIQDAQGHPRNALQILDQVLRVEQEQRLDVAKRSAEQISQSIDLCRALMQQRGWKTVSGILKGLKDDDAEKIRRHVLGYCQAVLLKEQNDNAALIMEEMIEPFFNTGFAGLTLACYTIVRG